MTFRQFERRSQTHYNNSLFACLFMTINRNLDSNNDSSKNKHFNKNNKKNNHKNKNNNNNNNNSSSASTDVDAELGSNLCPQRHAHAGEVLVFVIVVVGLQRHGHAGEVHVGGQTFLAKHCCFFLLFAVRFLMPFCF
ncbi:unnamed protein product [Polarella glacialis]|uniref:Uncharacterized protein n=1 Tax=Polarella glacialis TaxID=89957 RepID=A0A813LVU9_POLGL|nr:unnamed protein product [Polarella glacialis]